MTDVSVIIPAYNAEDFLADAIASVRSQRVSTEAIAMEVIVVDDGSNDATLNIAEQLADLVIHQPNGGTSSAVNAGLGAASAPILAFLDADDLWTTGRLAHQLAVLATGAVDAVFGHVEHFVDHELLARSGHPAGRQVGVARPLQPGWVRSAMVITRSAFDQVGPVSETEHHSAEAFEWQARAQRTGLRMSMLDDVVLRRRIHGRNKTMADAAQLQTDRLAILRSHVRHQRAAATNDDGVERRKA